MSMKSAERRAMFRVWWRIVPLMGFVLFFNALDRVNVGFAALQMNATLGISNTEFGVAAGMFSVGYLVFAIPSTLLLQRLGARLWISLIAIAWSLCSAATAFVTTPEALMGVRLLLGMAEAGFNPGLILYFSYWFPSEYRGRIFGSFFLVMPITLIIASPVSGAVLSWDVLLGLGGWQWMFIVEALPMLLVAPFVYLALTDRPADAHWLSSEEKEWLVGRLASEQRQVEESQSGSAIWRTLANGRVWMLGAIYLAIGTSGIGAILFLPLVIRSMGFSFLNTGFVAAVPALFAALMLPLWGVWTDRSRNPETIVAAACSAIALGLSGAAALMPSPWAIVPISLAMVGFFGCLPAFWMLPSAFLTGASAATGIAFITMAGNVGHFTGPALFGWMLDLTRSYEVALTCLAAIAAGTAAIVAAQAIRNRNSIMRTRVAEKPAAV